MAEEKSAVSQSLSVRDEDIPAPSSRNEWLARLQEEVSTARGQIETSDVPADVNQIRLRAELVATAAVQLKSEDLALTACEVQVRAERRLGQLRLMLPVVRVPSQSPRLFDYALAQKLCDSGMTTVEVARELGVTASAVRSAKAKGWPEDRTLAPGAGRRGFDEQLGLTRGRAHLFEKLGALDDVTWERLLSLFTSQKRHPTTAALVRAATTRTRRRVERGIYVLGDGRYFVQAQRDGTIRSKTLQGASARDLERARRELAILRGTFTGKTVRRSLKDLDAIASSAQILMQSISDAEASLSGKARLHLRAAYTHAAKMEQAIIRAINEASVA